MVLARRSVSPAGGDLRCQPAIRHPWQSLRFYGSDRDQRSEHEHQADTHHADRESCGDSNQEGFDPETHPRLPSGRDTGTRRPTGRQAPIENAPDYSSPQDVVPNWMVPQPDMHVTWGRGDDDLQDLDRRTRPAVAQPGPRGTCIKDRAAFP